MDTYAQLVQFPRPSDATLFALLGAFFGLVLAAVGIERIRRRLVRRVRLKAEWASLRNVIDDRELSDGEKKIIEDLVQRYSRLHPVSAVTTRHGFDCCVASAMSSVKASRNTGEFEKLGGQLREIRCRLGLDLVPIGKQIHTTRDLHAGQWISVAPEGSAKPRWFRTMVAIVDEANFYLKQHSSSDGVKPDFEVGDKVKCRMWRDEDARYFFSTTVEAHDPGPPMWRLAHTDDLARSQARQHFRIRHDQTVTLGVLNAPVDGNYEDIGDRPEVTKLRGRITSLSAGGFAVVIQQPVAKQVVLRVAFELVREEPVNLHARIVSCEPISGGRYLVRAAFVTIDEEARDIVSRFVSRRQQYNISETTEAE